MFRKGIAILFALGIGAPAFAQVTAPTTLSTLDVACGAATSCVTYAMIGNALTVDVTVTGTITLTFSTSLDGATYRSALVTSLGTGIAATTTTASGSFSLPNSGIGWFRVTVTAVSGGTAVVRTARGFLVRGGGGSTFTSPTFVGQMTGDGTPGDCTAPDYSTSGDEDTGLDHVAANQLGLCTGGTERVRVNTDSGTPVIVRAGIAIGATVTSADIFLVREGTDHLMQRNGATAQRLGVLNGYTSSTNYESFAIDWKTVANLAIVGTRTAATGTTRDMLLVSQASSASNFSAIRVSRASPLLTQGLADTSGNIDGTQSSTVVVWNRVGYLTSTASSGTILPFEITPIYNQTGTAGATDFLVNRTETALGSGAQNFLDLQIAGSSKFLIARTGGFTGVGASSIDIGSTGGCASRALEFGGDHVGFARNGDALEVCTNTSRAAFFNPSGGYNNLYNEQLLNGAAAYLSYVAGYPTTTLASLARQGSARMTAFSTATDVGNVGAGEDTLFTQSLTSLKLAANLQEWEVKTRGTFAATAANKRVRFRANDGSTNTVIFDTGALVTTTAQTWELDCNIDRISTTTAKASCRWTSDEPTLTAKVTVTAFNYTWASGGDLLITGEATNNNDVVASMWRGDWNP